MSTTMDYELKVLRQLARRSGEYIDAFSMAKILGIDAALYLGKVCQDLQRRGLLESKRGRHGGYRLSPGALSRHVTAIWPGVPVCALGSSGPLCSVSATSLTERAFGRCALGYECERVSRRLSEMRLEELIRR